MQFISLLHTTLKHLANSWMGAVLLALAMGLDSVLGGVFQPSLYTPIHAFTNDADGNQPVSLFFGPNNALFGVTYGGGPQGGGTVFTMNRDGSGYATLASFSPAQTGNSNTAPDYVISRASPFPLFPLFGGLMVSPGNDGSLYGTTYFGGTNNEGTVFKLTPNFTDGISAQLTVLRSFGAANDNPVNVIQGSDGALYGTTLFGGANGAGVIFRMATNGSDYSVLYNFGRGDGGNCSVLIQGSDGCLYGALMAGTNNSASGGTIFKIATNGGNYTDLTNFPGGASLDYLSGLIQGSDGLLYGTALRGSVFQINTNGGGFNILYAFPNSADGAIPIGLVEGPDGVLYGTTVEGGQNAGGTLYSISRSGSGFTVLNSFADNYAETNGYYPMGALAAGSFSGVSGVLYGTTTELGLTNGASQYTGLAYSLTINPPLTITPTTSATAGQTTVFWPAWAQNYTLQSTTNLSSPNWVNVTNGAQVVGVKVTNSAPATFYRLEYPQ